MPDFSGKVAVVSGAGSVAEGIGNGRAAAILLARGGARVGVIDIDADAAAETVRLVTEEGGSATAVQADVTEPDQAARAVSTIHDAYGRIDILVNNVGIIGPPHNAVEFDPDEWDHVMRVNVKSMMLMAKYCIPHITEAGGGAIVNLASGAGILAGHPALAYPTSKGAVISLTRAMAYHHGPAGIRVNCVAPGYVYTPRVASRTPPEREESERERRRMAAPLQTEGTGWDVGQTVVYLASEEARWVSGVTLPVDAGFSAGKV